MLEELDETELVKSLQSSNAQEKREAFASLVNKYSEMLYWQIRRIVLVHEDADDVLQEAFIKVWTNIDNFRADAKLSTWLYRIATNESITHLNKQKQEQSISIDDEDSFILNKLEADTFFDGESAEAKLQKAVLTLPEKQRIVFNMKYYDDMKYKDMSKVLATSVGALKASYHHAVKKVEEYLLSNQD